MEGDSDESSPLIPLTREGRLLPIRFFSDEGKQDTLIGKCCSLVCFQSLGPVTREALRLITDDDASDESGANVWSETLMPLRREGRMKLLPFPRGREGFNTLKIGCILVIARPRCRCL